MPFTYDGMQNYLIRMDGLPQIAQLEYLRSHLPDSQRCSLDLATPRSVFGDAWLSTFLDVAQLIRNAKRIRQKFRHAGYVTGELRKLAETNDISLATLYRLCGKPSSKELSMLYLDLVYLQARLPRIMYLWSADLAYAVYLDHHQHFSQNSIFRKLEAHVDVPSGQSLSHSGEIPVRPTLTAWMDTATGYIVGWVISILPNVDTIAEVFCHGAPLPKERSSAGFPMQSW